MVEPLPHSLRLLDEAQAQFWRAREEGHAYLLRDACLKAWRAVLLATDALLQAYGVQVPSEPYEKRRALLSLEKEDPRVEGAEFRARLASLEVHLHRDAFLDLRLDPGLLEKALEEAHAYIDEVEGLIERD